ncbi:hypothetical protein EE612_050104 [Oryza sativa]|nr:hypothetical protein EE612_050104 [Oryza sativa]
MAIVYAVVARGTVVLAEFSAVSGNAGAVARRILEKLPPDAESRLCFAQDRYIFHVLRSPPPPPPMASPSSAWPTTPSEDEFPFFTSRTSK